MSATCGAARGFPWRLPAPEVFSRLGILLMKICSTARSGVRESAALELRCTRVVKSGENGRHRHASSSAVNLPVVSRKVDVDVVDRVQAREGTTREAVRINAVQWDQQPPVHRHTSTPSLSSPSWMLAGKLFAACSRSRRAQTTKVLSRPPYVTRSLFKTTPRGLRPLRITAEALGSMYSGTRSSRCRCVSSFSHWRCF
jgi:hypothetical protein